ncbi:MAG: 5-formyltetrahydrofolate cyclo-ligase [Butyribacter sp.]|nr:5-formyltetrahydrofolate cyclo-ligase [bacterium]MDY3854735.1 5-formyltetrahydrofolate cyclo-ligase [Butyribacter sp.]
MTKTQARQYMKKKRQELSGEERKEKDRQIFERLFQMEQVRQAKWLFPFVSYGTEVDTLSIIEYVLSETGIRLAVPRVQGKEMDFFEIREMNQLQRGYRGILEPVTEKKVQIAEGIILMPGLAFDQNKNRVGYGGGFYDRYLAQCDGASVTTIALAYDFQIIDSIQTEKFDYKPDFLLTEKRIL